MFAPAYLDHNATTPVAAAVLEAMLPYFSRQYGNPSSRHEYGRAARRAVDEARQQVAAAMDAHPTEVVFTGGGSEGANLFLKGAAGRMKPGLLAVGATEHSCVLEPARQLGRTGWRTRLLQVDGEGRIARDDYAAALAEKPSLLSVMGANNESGVMQDVASLAEAAKDTGAWFHTDMVQAVAKVPLSFRELNRHGVHALTLAGHKIGGPKGVGALVLDKRVELEPLIAGGGHERGLRAGTENVPAIVGLGIACALAAERQRALAAVREHRDRMEAALRARGAAIFGAGAERLPNTSFFALPGIDGETLVGRLDRAGFAVASGSACSSENPDPSHVLSAMGVPATLARGAVRVSLGPDDGASQVTDFIAALDETLNQLNRLAALAS